MSEKFIKSIEKIISHLEGMCQTYFEHCGKFKKRIRTASWYNRWWFRFIYSERLVASLTAVSIYRTNILFLRKLISGVPINFENSYLVIRDPRSSVTYSEVRCFYSSIGVEWNSDDIDWGTINPVRECLVIEDGKVKRVYQGSGTSGKWRLDSRYLIICLD